MFAMKALGNLYHNIFIFLWYTDVLLKSRAFTKVFVKYVHMHIISNLSKQNILQ